MKALVKATEGEGLELLDVEEPAFGDRDVLIRILKTAICGTDMHIWEWDDWARRAISVPTIVGHEFVGRIERCGVDVRGLETGQLVSGEGHVVCGHCRNCRAGRRHLCPNTVSVGSSRAGAFAEFLALPATNVWPIESGIPLDVASVFDPLGNAVHTALAYDLVGEDVLITGAGPIGCMAAAVARHVGARNVVVTDVNPYRLELACSAGATVAVDAREGSLDETMTQLGMREGFDVGLEMSGSPQAFQSMLDVMCSGGRIALLGFLEGRHAIDWERVIFGGLTIKGIYGREMYETWYKMTALIQSGLDVEPLITHRFPCTDYQTAFAVMRSGRAGKVILEWSDS